MVFCMCAITSGSALSSAKGAGLRRASAATQGVESAVSGPSHWTRGLDRETRAHITRSGAVMQTEGRSTGALLESNCPSVALLPCPEREAGRRTQMGRSPQAELSRATVACVPSQMFLSEQTSLAWSLVSERGIFRSPHWLDARLPFFGH